MITLRSVIELMLVIPDDLSEKTLLDHGWNQQSKEIEERGWDPFRVINGIGGLFLSRKRLFDDINEELE
uniref:SAM-dependent methyltransferase n=1 Tax=Caenorhabditis tropicalis TaxID=1561998 RepID=A0A1I7U019_9PELO